MEIQEKKENIALGILGALIGGLIGGASIILFGQMGMVSALSGVILAFCTLKGYELLGKERSVLGTIVCVVIMLAVPYFADRVNWAIAIVKQSAEVFGYKVLFGDAFLHAHRFIEYTGNVNNYWKDLLFIYGFAALGAFTIVKQPIKKKTEE